MYDTTNIWIFFHVFLVFNYWNSDIGMFVLRSSISVQVSKKIFGIITGEGVQISTGWGLEKNSKINKWRVGGVYLVLKSIP